jgi:hypothetical protein
MQLQRLHRWSLMAFIMALVMLMLVLILMFNLHYSSIVMRIVLMLSHQLGTSLQQIIIYHCTICASCYWTCITIINSTSSHVIISIFLFISIPHVELRSMRFRLWFLIEKFIEAHVHHLINTSFHYFS